VKMKKRMGTYSCRGPSDALEPPRESEAIHCKQLSLMNEW
jgi:hypothetical protein